MVTINPSRKHGVASIESVRGRLRISIPRACFGGQQKYLTLGLSDTPKNREIANCKLESLQSDINLGHFDPTLERYKPQTKQQDYLKLIEKSRDTISLTQLWQEYLVYLKPIRKPTTMAYLEETISYHINKCPIVSPFEALAIRSWLLEVTTPSMTKRVLTQLNAACNWAISNRKLSSTLSPFAGMAKEFKHRYEETGEPNAFTFEERDRILYAFKNHKIKGYSYSHYTPFVDFMFLTGCRPSEAIGLKWEDIDPSYRFITFDGGIVYSHKKKISTRGQGGKNNRKRKFPCNEMVRDLLMSLPKTHSFVFPSVKGKIINYNDFSRRAWNAIVDPIKPNTTPYSCRDTFITEQIAKGVSAAIIAKWVDDSVRVIEKHYLDMTAIEHILPQ